MQINDNLIREVFDEIVKYNPEYYTDDFINKLRLERRRVPLEVCSAFPLPIGNELQILFAIDERKLDLNRLKQLFKTMERTVQFISFIMLSQLWVDKSAGKITIPQEFSKEFDKRFRSLSLGTYTCMIKGMGEIYSDQNAEWFMPEMKEQFTDELYKSLNLWPKDRNLIDHHDINPSSEGIERLCLEYEDMLTLLLKRIAFLLKYKLISINEINISKARNKTAKFAHRVNFLDTISHNNTEEIADYTYTDCRSVGLTKSINSVKEFLNLSPLVIDTHSEVLNSTSKNKYVLKKDIFMYTGSNVCTETKGDRLYYAGITAEEQYDLRALSNYDELLFEYKELVKTILS